MKSRYADSSLAETAIDLLCEFTKICDENKLDYFLSPAMLKRVQDDLDYNEYFVLPEIYMFVDDILKLIDVIEAEIPEDRGLDYLRTNGDWPGMNLSYVNRRTTYLVIAKGTDIGQHGVRILVHAICDDTKDRLLSLLEGWLDQNTFSYGAEQNRKGSKKKQMLYGMLTTAKQVCPGALSKWMFSSLADKYRGKPNSKRVFVKPDGRKKCYFDRKIFKKKTTIDFCDHTFTVPAKIDAYMKSFYGPRVKLLKATPFYNRGVLISTTVPYETFIKHLDDIGMPTSKLFEDYDSVRIENNSNVEQLSAVDSSFEIALMSRDRQVFYEAFQKNIDLIRQMRENNDFKGLQKYFAKYEKRARYYLDLGFTLCPDEELFDILCAILENKGDSKIVKRLRENLNERHKKPLIEIS